MLEIRCNEPALETMDCQIPVVDEIKRLQILVYQLPHGAIRQATALRLRDLQDKLRNLKEPLYALD